jgi:hypothetical protein
MSQRDSMTHATRVWYSVCCSTTVVRQSIHLWNYFMAYGNWKNEFGFNFSQLSLSYRCCSLCCPAWRNVILRAVEYGGILFVNVQNLLLRNRDQNTITTGLCSNDRHTPRNSEDPWEQSIVVAICIKNFDINLFPLFGHLFNQDQRLGGRRQDRNMSPLRTLSGGPANFLGCIYVRHLSTRRSFSLAEIWRQFKE